MLAQNGNASVRPLSPLRMKSSREERERECEEVGRPLLSYALLLRGEGGDGRERRIFNKAGEGG